MTADTSYLKSHLKRGPYMSRQMRAEFALSLIDAPTRQLSPATAAKLKAEIDRLAHSEDPAAKRFAQQMRERYPHETS